MPEPSESPSPTLITSYIDKVANTQSSIQELQREIARLRQDARADGFNMEAVHQLGLIVAKSPHDNGAGLLRDISTYAHQVGIEPDSVVVRDDTPVSTHTQDRGSDSFDVSHYIDKKRFFDDRISLILQLALGFLLGGTFIWFLH